MSGFKNLAREYDQGDAGTVPMIDRATGTISTPASVLSDTLYLQFEGQGFHANADGNIALESPPLRGSKPGSAGKVAVFTVKAGGFYPYRFSRIKATGTTLAASAIVLFYEPY